MATHYTRPVAAIRGKAGGIAGTGCLILGRYVLTCAHVIDLAVGRDCGSAAAPNAELTVDLQFLNRLGLSARVVAWYPYRPSLADLVGDPLADIAVLELAVEGELPGSVGPGDVDRTPQAAGSRFLTYGYPEGFDAGIQASGEVQVAIPGGWLQVRATKDDSYGYFIAPGFSGAPVFLATAPGGLGAERRLIGLAAQADQDEEKRLAFVLPAQQLCKACPELARPYLGLFAFGEEEADLFFGREAFIAELAGKLEDHPFTAVVGPSGSGKSSAVLAGLVPRLRDQGWRIAMCRPLRNPLRELAMGLVPLLDPRARTLDARERLAEGWHRQLAEDPGRILDLARRLAEAARAGRTLLVIDQFEELFTADATSLDGAVARKAEVTREDGSPRQAAFLKVLEAIAGQDARTAPIQAVATLRADFMGAALEIGRLAGLLREADVKLGPINSDGIRAAIRQPAAAFGVLCEKGLVEKLVLDMKGRPGALPLLQFALEQLWKRQSDRRLTLAAYSSARVREIPDKSGLVEASSDGLDTALNRHAEEVLTDVRNNLEYGDGAEDKVRRIMLRLVRLGDGVAPDARTVVRRSEFEAEDWLIVQKLANERARLVVIGRDSKDGEETAEVVHEALIGAWDRLRNWLEADRAFGLWRQRLKGDLERWSGRPEDAFLRGGILAEATGWVASHREQLNDREQDFIKVSEANARQEDNQKLREAEERAALAAENQRRAEALAEQEHAASAQQKRMNTWLLGTIALLLLALALGTFLFRDAQHQRNVAITAAREQSRARAEADAAAKSADEAKDAVLATAREVKARQLAAEALGLQHDTRDLATAQRAAALAVEGWRLLQTAEASQAAYTALRELPVAYVEQGAAAFTLAFSPDGKLLLSGGQDGAAKISRVEDGVEIARVVHGDSISGAAFSSDGSLILTGSGDGTARVSRTRNGSEVARVEHGKVVWAVAFSSDGELILTGGGDGTARVSLAGNGVEIARVEHGATVRAVAFSPDGKLILTGSDDGTARLSRASDGGEIARIEHGDSVTGVAFSSDSSMILTGGDDGTARVSRASTGGEIARVAHSGRVKAVAFSPDASLILTGDDDGDTRVSHAGDGSEIARVDREGIGRSVTAVAFSPDGKLILTGAADGTGLVSRAGDGREIARVEHGAPVEAVAFSPDGRLILTGDDDGIVRVSLSVAGGEIARVEHGNWVHAVAFSPDGRLILTGAADGTARVSRTSDGAEIAQVEHGAAVIAVGFSPDAALILTAGFDGTARVSRASDGGQIARVEHGNYVTSVAFSPDGRLILTGSDDGTARVSRARDGGEIAWVEHGAAVETVAFSPDGTLILTGGEDGIARVSRASDGREIARIENDGPIFAVAFSSDGSRILTGSGDGTARVSRSSDGGEIARVEQDAPILAVAFSPDGSQILTGALNGTARVSRANEGSEIARVEHGDHVEAVAFSPDGSLILTGSWDGTARVSRASDGEEIARVENGGRILAAAFSPDGTLILTGSDDGTARVSPLPEAVFAKVCGERAGRNLSAAEWRRHMGALEDWAPTCPHWRSDSDLLATWKARQRHANAKGGSR